MTKPISKDAFTLLRKYVETHCGIVLGEDKEYLVQNRLTKLLVDSGRTDFDDFYRHVISGKNPEYPEKIIDAMTTNETLWFRDESPFQLMESTILPEMINSLLDRKQQKVRIWSAACSTGQEPYSLAMTINDVCSKLRHGRIMANKFEIVASDISPTALMWAKKGKYNQFTMRRGMKKSSQAKYFTASGNTWIVNDEIKRMVDFKKVNLQHDFKHLGQFDMILCRNVAIYFSATFKRDLFRRIEQSLRPPGYFFLGASETLHGLCQGMESVATKEGNYYRLKGKGPANLKL